MKNLLKPMFIMAIFAMALGSCSDELGLELEQDLEQQETLDNLEAPDGDGELVLVSLEENESNLAPDGEILVESRGSDPWFVDLGFLNVVNYAQGTPGNVNFFWECCLERGNWGDGKRYYVQTSTGTSRPGFFYVDLTIDGDAIDEFGFTAMFRGGGFIDLPFDENLPLVEVFVDGMHVGNTRLDLSEWGTTALVLTSVETMPGLNLDAEYCYAAQQFGHVEPANVFETICLTLKTTNGIFAVNMVEEGLEDATTGNLILPIVEASLTDESTELVQIQLLESLSGNDPFTLWTVPDYAVHGPGSIGCPISLQPRDCDDDPVVNCDPLPDCTDTGVRNIINDSPSGTLVDIFDDVMRRNADDRIVTITNSGISVDGTSRNTLARMTANSNTFAESVGTIRRSGSLSGNRVIFNGGNTFSILFEGGGELVVGPGQHPYTAFTPLGVYSLMLDRDNLSNNGELVFERLIDQVIPVVVTGTTNVLGEIRVPHETLQVLEAQGANVFVNFVDDADGKVIRVYQDSDGCRHFIAGAAEWNGLKPGIDLAVDNIVFFSDAVDCRIVSRVGFPVSNILADDGKHYYAPIESLDL